MSKSLHNTVSTSGGEVSPKLDARVDQQKYGTWLRQSRNMIPYRTGGLTRAPGTLQIAPAKRAVDSNNYCVNLIKFTFSQTTTFELEFGHQYIRFYSNKQQVQTSPGVAYEIASPYTANAGTGSIYDTEVFKLAVCEINDVVYITSPNRAPYILTRIADTNWTLAQVNFLIPPLLDQNATGLYIGISAGGTTGAVTMSINAAMWAAATFYQVGDAVNASSHLYVCVFGHTSSGTFPPDLAAGYWVEQFPFQAGHVGSVWQLGQRRDAAYATVNITANGNSGTILALGNCTFQTFGTWNADVELQRQDPGGSTWSTVQVVTSRLDTNASVPVVVTTQGTYRIVVANWVATGGATTPRATFTVPGQIDYGLVQITSITSAYLANGNVTKALVSTNGTYLWSEGAWSNFRGFPQAVTSFQQRVIYGGSAFEPQRIWGSATNDLENFDRSDPSIATNSFAFDLNAPGRGPIQWLIAQGDLFVGFNGAEWIVNSGQTSGNNTASGAAIGPTSINAVEQGTYGSAPFVQPTIVGNSAFFVQRQGDSMRQMQFNFYINKYQSIDLCALADHLFISRIAQIAYQARWRHQGLVWVVTKQGTLCGLSYDLDGEIGGWCRRDTGYGQTAPDGTPIANDNGFESVSTLPGATGEDDQVWVVTNRVVGGSNVRFIELVNPSNWEETFTSAPTPPAPVLANAFYVDCGAVVTSPGALTFNVPALANLVGRYVVGLADGNALGPILVGASGSVTLPDAVPTTVQTVVLGLPIAYAGQPMRIDMDVGRGNTQALVKSISDVFVRVWNSAGGAISNGTATYAFWVSGTSYVAGNSVISPADNNAYQCKVANSGTTDPSLDTTNWAATSLPSFQQPVPIPYTPTNNTPWGARKLVTVPTDIRVTPQNMPTLGTDPQFIVSGNDALPVTVLGITLKYDVASVP